MQLVRLTKKGKICVQNHFLAYNPQYLKSPVLGKKLIQTENDHHYIDEIEDPNS